MKIRNGFVSNSSTSSFCIFGAYVSEDLEHAATKLGLTTHHLDPNMGYDEIVVGLNWYDILDEETGKQFQDRVNDMVSTLVGKEVKCSTCMEAWRDG